MLITTLAMLTAVATAQDANDDGCVDTYFDANGACVAVNASIGPDTTVGASVYIGERAVVVGRSALSGNRPIGADTTIGRRTFIGADHEIGSDNTIARGITAGARLETGSNAFIGYGTVLGDDVFIGSAAVVGTLGSLGNHTRLEPSAVVARGVTIADSDSTASIAGVIGPDVTIGSGFTMSSGARIRKQAQLGNDVTMNGTARIGRGAIIGDGAVIGDGARVSAGAEVTANTHVPDGLFIARGETYDDPVGGAFSGGTLLDEGEMTQINGWVGDANAEWSLCFKSSVDGMTATAFHAGCDSYGETVVVATTSTRKLGAYTPISWATNDSYNGEPTDSTFLFSLTNNHKHALMSNRSSLAIVALDSYGPTFGGGHDIMFFRNGGTPYCNLGHSYACRVSSGNTCAIDLCGAYNPSFTEIEVYGRQ